MITHFCPALIVGKGVNPAVCFYLPKGVRLCAVIAD